jgi:polyketide cyclase/dehydrase/lipid transport protein
MSVITCAVDIAAPAADLFTLSQDYNRRLRWDPFLREARLLNGAQNAAVGVRAWCVARNGLGMETTYVSFQPPTVVAVKMTRGPRIISAFAGSWRFTELPSQSGSTRTRVVFRYQIAGHPRWLAFLLDPLLAAIFRRETQRRLLALKRAVETTSILQDIAAESSSDGSTPGLVTAPADMTSRSDQNQSDSHG